MNQFDLAMQGVLCGRLFSDRLTLEKFTFHLFNLWRALVGAQENIKSVIAGAWHCAGTATSWLPDHTVRKVRHTDCDIEIGQMASCAPLLAHGRMRHKRQFSTPIPPARMPTNRYLPPGRRFVLAIELLTGSSSTGYLLGAPPKEQATPMSCLPLAAAALLVAAWGVPLGARGNCKGTATGHRAGGCSGTKSSVWHAGALDSAKLQLSCR